MTAEPDPRTAADDDEDATNEGRSTQSPAEGGDAVSPPGPGSPREASPGDAELGAGTTGG